jgi:hypothetical protein
MTAGGPRWIEPSEVTFSQSPHGNLRLTVADRSYRRVNVVRALPLSDADEYLSVRSGDDEIGVLRALADLDAEQGAMVAAQLEQRYFRPLITRVMKVRDHSGTFHWDVETDRGAVSFASKHPRHSATRLGANRWLITDVDNNRYEVRDAGELDRRSRGILMLLLG